MIIEKVFIFFGITAGWIKGFLVNNPFLFFWLLLFCIFLYGVILEIVEPKWVDIVFSKKNSIKVSGINKVGIAITNNTPYELSKCKANLIRIDLNRPLDVVLKWSGYNEEYIDIARGDTKVLELVEVNTVRAVVTYSGIRKTKKDIDEERRKEKKIEYSGRFSTTKSFRYDIVQGFHEAELMFLGSINGKPLKPKIKCVEFKQLGGEPFIIKLSDL